MKKTPGKAVRKLAPPLARQLDRLTRMEAIVHQLNAKVDHLTALAEIRDNRIDELKRLVGEVEPYQPTYGVAGIIDKPRRGSADRCQSIMAVFDNDVAKYRVLDIGSSLGYVSFFLADRGAEVEGWEVSPSNLAAAKAVQAVNGIPVNFMNKAITLETAKAIPKNKFDIAIALSIFHHVVYDEGIETTQKIVKELTEKIPVLIVELARKGEDKKLWWDSAQPKNELDIFKGLDVKIEIIGEADTHLSSSSRNLYKVTRNNAEVNRRMYPIKRTTRLAYPKSIVPLSGLRREYITSDQVFIKRYYFDEDTYDNTDQIVNEINVLNSLRRMNKNHPLMVKMEDFEIKDDEASIVFKKLDGKLAEEAEELAGIIGYDKMLRDLIDVLAFLEEVGYHHNDIRSWNIMVTKKHAVLIDYGLAAPLPTTDNVGDLVRAVHALMTGKREHPTLGQKDTLPPRRDINGEHLLQLYSLAEKGEKSFVAVKKSMYGDGSRARS